MITLNSTYSVEIVKGKSITIYNHDKKTKNTFTIGDMAEYDSYNLSYYGPIQSITEKTVTIANRHSGKKSRLKLDTFAWRNWDFELGSTMTKNADTMNYI